MPCIAKHKGAMKDVYLWYIAVGNTISGIVQTPTTINGLIWVLTILKISMPITPNIDTLNLKRSNADVDVARTLFFIVN